MPRSPKGERRPADVIEAARTSSRGMNQEDSVFGRDRDLTNSVAVLIRHDNRRAP
jgi:hypothetical protein